MKQDIVNSNVAPHLSRLAEGLRQEFQLDGRRLNEDRYYRMKTEFVPRAPDGGRQNSTSLTLYLEVLPDPSSSEERLGSTFVCRRFAVIREGSPPFDLQSLAGFSYRIKGAADDKGQIFGIDHSRFRSLVDHNQAALPIHETYWVYNVFVDFHTFCNVIAENTPCGNGIQDLKRLGDRVVHASAGSSPPIDLLGTIQKGSQFDNGDVAISFLGVTRENGHVCALVNFDSGDCTYTMQFEPMAQSQVKVVGYSHYKGVLTLNLDDYWIEKVHMDEVVISQMTMNDKVIDSPLVLRDVTVEQLDRSTFDREAPPAVASP